MQELITGARLQKAKGAALESEALALGAVNVEELAADDWQGLASWKTLLPCEQRRVLAHLRLARGHDEDM